MGNSYKEYLRGQHPELFSDAKKKTKPKLCREVLALALQTLSANSKEHQFERYCCELVRRSIAPNLIYQTGPTGGGDSKVDSETFPVDSSLAELWPYPEAEVAAGERWAFAISLKQDWRSKVQSDVRKIKDVEDSQHRGYTKVFFLSNQNISDKKRAEVEDSLRNETGFDVRILDVNWLLEKSLENEQSKLIAVKELGLSEDLLEESDEGILDSQRSARLREIENTLNTKANKLSTHEKIDLANEAAEVACSLELSDDAIVGHLERHYRLAKKYGDVVEQGEAVYLYAYRLAGFCETFDIDLFYERYVELEALALKHRSKFLIENLATLWAIMKAQCTESASEINFGDHVAVIRQIESDLAKDGDRVTTSIEVSMRIIPVRLMSGESPEQLLDEAIQLLNRSKQFVGIDSRIIVEMLNVPGAFDRCPRYDEAMELIYERVRDKAGSSALAPSLFARGVSLEKESRYYDSIRMYTRTLLCIRDENDKGNYIKTLIRLSTCYEQIGLLWFARNTSLMALNIAIDMYYGSAELESSMLFACNRLKYLELKTGRIQSAIKLDCLESRLSSLFSFDRNQLEEDAELFGQLLAACILMVNLDEFKGRLGVPEALLDCGYPYAAQMARYVMGHYDEEALAELSCTETEYDEYVRKFFSDAEKAVELPRQCTLAENGKFNIETKLLGCSIRVCTEMVWQSYEVASTVLAALEGFLGTGLTHGLYAMSESISIDVTYDPECETLLGVSESDNGFDIVVGRIQETPRKKLSEELQSFLAIVLAEAIEDISPIGFTEEVADELADSDFSVSRALSFSDTISSSGSFIDDLPFRLFSSEEGMDYLPCKRETPLILRNGIGPSEKFVEQQNASSGLLPHSIDVESLSHRDVTFSSVIDMSLWNKADWQGVGYLLWPDGRIALALCFGSDSGDDIFRKWLLDKTTKERIRIGIVKGISKSSPLNYRVVVTSAFPSMEKAKEGEVVTTAARIKTVEPEALDSLELFESHLPYVDDCLILPARFVNGDMELHWDYGIVVNSKNITIQNAYEVTRDDYVSCFCLFSTDNLVIPEGLDGSAVLSVIEAKKVRE